MNRKGAITRRNYQVLRDDASPRGVNSISFNSGEAHTALRGWRPISAVLLAPVPSFFVPGSEDFPNQPPRPTASMQPEEYRGYSTVLSTRFPGENKSKKIGGHGTPSRSLIKNRKDGGLLTRASFEPLNWNGSLIV